MRRSVLIIATVVFVAFTFVISSSRTYDADREQPSRVRASQRRGRARRRLPTVADSAPESESTSDSASGTARATLPRVERKRATQPAAVAAQPNALAAGLGDNQRPSAIMGRDWKRAPELLDLRPALLPLVPCIAGTLRVPRKTGPNRNSAFRQRRAITICGDVGDGDGASMAKKLFSNGGAAALEIDVRLGLWPDTKVVNMTVGGPPLWSAPTFEQVRPSDRCDVALARPRGCPAAVGATPAAFALADDRRRLEGYTVRVTVDRILVEACHWHGALNALRTLAIVALSGRSQLVRRESNGDATVQPLDSANAADMRHDVGYLPDMVFDDVPATAWRGQHLDIARNFVTLPTIVRRVLVPMALAKLNVLHLHLSDDQGYRAGSILFPRLAEHGGKRGARLNGRAMKKYAAADGGSDGRAASESASLFLSPAEMRWLVSNATSRGIHVVPELDLPAHTTAFITGLEAELTLRLFGESDSEKGRTRNTADDHERAFREQLAALPPARVNSVDQGMVDARNEPIIDVALREAAKCRTFFWMASTNGKHQSGERFAAGGVKFFTGYYQLSNEDCDATRDTTSKELTAVNCMGGVHGIVWPSEEVGHCIRAVIAEMALLFGDIVAFHIGGDQAAGIRDVAWGAYISRMQAGPTTAPPNGGAYRDEIEEEHPQRAQADGFSGEALQADFTAGLARFVRSALKMPAIVWDDAVVRAEGDAASGVALFSKSMPCDIAVMVWREDRVTWAAVFNAVNGLAALSALAGEQTGPDPYELDPSSTRRRVPNPISPGYRGPWVIYAGKTRLYFDYAQHSEAKKNKIWPLQQPGSWLGYAAVSTKRVLAARHAIERGKKAGVPVAGLQGCLWTELLATPDAVYYQLVPRVFAVAQVGWSLAATVPPADPAGRSMPKDTIMNDVPKSVRVAKSVEKADVDAAIANSDAAVANAFKDGMRLGLAVVLLNSGAETAAPKRQP